MSVFFQIILAQIGCTIIGILFIKFCVTEMAKGSARLAGVTTKYFASNPILFSCIGGLNLTVGVIFCFAALPVHYIMPYQTLWKIVLIATWVATSFVSYLIGNAGQN